MPFQDGSEEMNREFGQRRVSTPSLSPRRHENASASREDIRPSVSTRHESQTHHGASSSTADRASPERSRLSTDGRSPSPGSQADAEMDADVVEDAAAEPVRNIAFVAPCIVRNPSSIDSSDDHPSDIRPPLRPQAVREQRNGEGQGGDRRQQSSRSYRCGSFFTARTSPRNTTSRATNENFNRNSRPNTEGNTHTNGNEEQSIAPYQGPPGLERRSPPGLHQQPLPGLHYEPLPGLHQQPLPGLHYEPLPGLHQQPLPGLRLSHPPGFPPQPSQPPLHIRNSDIIPLSRPIESPQFAPELSLSHSQLTPYQFPNQPSPIPFPEYHFPLVAIGPPEYTWQTPQSVPFQYPSQYSQPEPLQYSPQLSSPSQPSPFQYLLMPQNSELYPPSQLPPVPESYMSSPLPTASPSYSLSQPQLPITPQSHTPSRPRSSDLSISSLLQSIGTPIPLTRPSNMTPLEYIFLVSYASAQTSSQTSTYTTSQLSTHTSSVSNPVRPPAAEVEPFLERASPRHIHELIRVEGMENAAVTPRGTILIFFKEDCKLELSVNNAIRILHNKYRTEMSLSANGESANLSNNFNHIHQYSSSVNLVAMDKDLRVHRYAKIWNGGICFTSNFNTNVYLMDTNGVRVTTQMRPDTVYDHGLSVFLDGARVGAEITQQACEILSQATYNVNSNGVTSYLINGLRVDLGSHSMLSVQRDGSNYSLRTNLHSGFSRMTTDFMQCTSSVRSTNQLFVRQGPRSVFINGQYITARDGVHTAVLNRSNTLVQNN